MERIVAAAVHRDGMTFTIPPPARHHTIVQMMLEKFGIPCDQSSEQGFLTDAGEFVRRKPAAVIARNAGQIPEEKRTDPQDTLFSEDLW